jgi:diguanylate cyclase (GGDEF)-like protein
MRRWTIVVACLVLIIYIGFLLGANYRSQVALRGAALESLRLDIEKRAATVDYFLSERRNDLQAIVGNKDLSGYFVNKALGISERYGLKVNLFVIERLFNQVLQEKVIQDDPIYNRILFVDEEGNVLVDTAGGKDTVGQDWQANPFPESRQIRVRVTGSGSTAKIFLTAPYFFKNNFRGQVIARLSSKVLLDHVVAFSGRNFTGNIQIVTDDGQTVLSRVADGKSPFEGFYDDLDLPLGRFKFFDAKPSDCSTLSMAALKISIKNAPLFLVFAAPIEQIYSRMTPRLLLLATGSLALIILCVVGIMIRVNTQNLVLKTRIDEADRQKGYLARQNTKLEQEIELRTRVEGELINKQRQVEEQTLELQKSMERTYSLAYYDTLTGLPNRELCLDRLTQTLVSAKRNKTHPALLFLDLDRFKNINDSLGHANGDILLKLVAERLKFCVRDEDTVARIGGDEFIIILSSIHHGEDVNSVAQKIIEAMDFCFNLDGNEVFTSASIGISIFPEDGEDVQTLLKNADMAMYSAKEKGRNTYRFFSSELNSNAMQRREMEVSLRKALERKELYLVYQPQVEVLSGKIIGFEALLRWRHPHNGIVHPKDFISLAEDTGLILSIGEWVLRTACVQAQSWRSAGITDFRIAVNMSGRQFHQVEMIDIIEGCLADTGLPPGFLELELTESIVMNNAHDNIRALTELKKRGVKITIDDFGTGYSSLSYLKDFPIDRIKIDQGFIRDILSSPNDAAIVDAIIAMGESLAIEVLAEGVETRAQLDFLLSRRCRQMQGFYFFPPLAADVLTTKLLRETTESGEPEIAANSGFWNNRQLG